MHIQSFQITNVRALAAVRWELPEGISPAGWHVIIGDNGAGKSTLLRSVALGLIGPRNAEALRQDWNEWLASSAESGGIELLIEPGFDDVRPVKLSAPFWAGLSFSRSKVGVEIQSVTRTADPYTWNDKGLRIKAGWFSASFGPFRRFTGGNSESEKLFSSHPQLARHLSVFGEDVALTECLAWLSQLRFDSLEKIGESGRLLERIKAFLNQDGFLPQAVKFDGVDSKQVRFVDGHGVIVPVTALGDGFRSILSFTFELLRQMSGAWSDEELFEESSDGGILVRRSGVVLIDEIDAHLHPTWQRRIGFWFTRYFPKVQFIVTTHSPLVCHAAEHGTIFRLPTPGSEEDARMVTGLERERLVFGSVLDAYGTELFGADVSRSETAKQKQERLALLNQKALMAKLNTRETRERDELQSLFPASM